MTIFHIDPVNGDDGNDGLSWATAWKTWTSGATAARLSPGAFIKIAKSPDPVSAGINATFTAKSAAVTLASALTKEICDFESAWTPVSPNTRAQDTLYNSEGSAQEQFTISGTFTSGKAAYFDLGEAKDFSAYDSISLTIRSNIDLQSGDLQIVLCSDAEGATAVNTITIAQIIAGDSVYPAANVVTVDSGGALGSNIRSVALYTTRDFGAATIRLDNLIACNGFSLNSLIGVNDGFWYAIRAITDDLTVYLGTPNMSGYSPGQWNQSAVGSQPLYYRNPTPFTLPASVDETTPLEAVQEAGSAGSINTYSGGWNTSTDIQDGDTYEDFLSTMGYGFYDSGKSYIKFERLYAVRGYVGWYFTSTVFDVEFKNIGGIGCNYSGHSFDVNVSTGIVYSGTIKFITCGAGSSQGIFSLGTGTRGIVSTADIYVIGIGTLALAATGNAVRFKGRGHDFKGKMVVGNGAITTVAVLFDTDADFIRVKEIQPIGTMGYFLSVENGKELYVETVDMQTDVTAFFYPQVASGRIRVGLLKKNSYTVENYISVSGSPWRAALCSIDIVNASGRWYAGGYAGSITDQITGGQAESWAYGGSGTCLYITPNSATYGFRYTFFLPVTAGVNYRLHFQQKASTVSWNGSAYIKWMAGCGIRAIEDVGIAAATTSWAEWGSPTFSPSYSGFVSVTIDVYGTVGSLGIDDIHLVEVGSAATTTSTTTSSSTTTSTSTSSSSSSTTTTMTSP